MTTYALLTCIAVLTVTLPLWWEAQVHRVYVAACALAAALLVALAVVLLFAADLGADAVSVHLGVVLLAAVAVVAGGPVTAAVLANVEDRAGAEAAERVLRGGAWIGVLERTAVYLAITVGSPEALALVVAVKGLGRYPELQSRSHGAAERFIVGTFASILWAAGCALVAVRLRG
ncbi:MAG: hypothetical protein JWO46_2038 [Nocardioidaceae bacterium]|nr:hypothetical protein [Nocardioidaceae bacterium]